MKKVFAILAIVALASCGGSESAAPAVDSTAVDTAAAVTVDTAAAVVDSAAAVVDSAAAAAPAAK